MFNVAGPVNGHFITQIMPENGKEGAIAVCTGGELDIEFQARVVDSFPERILLDAVNETSWKLTSDVEISRC
jgi:hypothetical protein